LRWVKKEGKAKLKEEPRAVLVLATTPLCPVFLVCVAAAIFSIRRRPDTGPDPGSDI
jgi:hypothetical protein